jgi:hypothetical protein
MGESLWKENKLKEVIAEIVLRAGMPDSVRAGYGPYSSCLFVDRTVWCAHLRAIQGAGGTRSPI